MTSWIIPSNPEIYDLETAALKDGKVSWQQRRNRYSVGDVVYFYLTGKEKAVRFRGIVEETDISGEGVSDDGHWNDTEEFYRDVKWMTVVIDGCVSNDRLGLSQLREHGLKGNMQSPVKNVPDELLEFMEDVFGGPCDIYPDSEGVEEVLVEGACKTIRVNAYERNAVARERCIQHHGSSCNICGFDFGETYGDYAKGFIHVHHIVPLYEIGERYVVDPIRDLIPVCPNCHAMLHHKRKDGKCPTVDELKELFGKS